MTDIRRKLYRRGSSYETTIPMPLLFALDLTKKQNVIFTYDKHANRWYLGFEEAETQPPIRNGNDERDRRRR
ncbi:MAG: hypothetical protein Q7R76_05955 [Candidatus Woesearchaeota archaeon]|nr:hypothetical protein [Candidatus Woesearchaeota archaeon]